MSFFLVVVLICGAIGVDYINENALFNRNKVILKTDNVKITVPMMQYFFYDTVYKNAEYYATYQGLDPDKPLRKQQYLGTKDMTWFDYLMDDYLEEAQVMISYAEEAIRNGITLNENDLRKVEYELKKIKDQAEGEGQSLKEYIRFKYGKGVTKEIIKEAIELRTLAYKRLYQYNSQFEFTDEQIENRFSFRKDKYLYVDYKEYTFETEGASKSEKELAEELAQVKDHVEFNTWLILYHAKKLGYDDPGKLPEDKGKEINKKVENTLRDGTLFDYKKYEDESSIIHWLFEGALTENARKPGDSIVRPGPRAGTWTVYYVVKSPYRDESETRDVRYLFFGNDVFGGKENAYNAAVKAYNEWKKEDDQSEDKFMEYELLYNDFSYRPARNVKKGQYVKELDSWMFAFNRKPGDSTLMQIENEGTYVFFYVGKGKPSWQADIISELIEIKMEEINQNKTEEFTITIVKKNIDLIP